MKTLFKVLIHLFPQPIKCWTLSLLVLLYLPITLSAQDEGGVLVAAESSPVSAVHILDVRRLYLGLAIDKQSQIKAPVLNMSHHDTYKKFLKNVMHMTENGYKRKRLKRVFRQGTNRIIQFTSTKQLVDYLKNNPNTVTYMTTQSARKIKGIKVVQVLW